MWRLPALFALLALAPHAHAATVRTLDGKFHEGQIKLEGRSALAIHPPAGPPVIVELSNLLAADFRPPAAPPPAVAPRWSARDIGAVAAPGNARFDNGEITIRAAGTGIGGTKDAGQFLLQSLPGDGEVIARITSLQQSHPHAKAALVFRASLDPAAPGVALAYNASGNLAFQHRPKPAANTAVREGGALELPLFLKLSRRDNTFSAYSSTDGQDWLPIGSQEVTLPANAFAGLAVSSNTDHAVTTATFDNVAVNRSLSLRPDQLGTTPASRGVVLRNGSVITGQVRTADGASVRISRPREPNLAIPQAQVSRIFFAPLTADLVSRLPADREGALLATGDFIEGQLLDLNESRVKLSSILFGIKRFPTREVAAIAFPRPIQPAAARFHLSAADGSSLLFNHPELAAGMLHIKDPVLSPLMIPLAEIHELRAGPALVTPLSALKPAVEPKGDSPRYAINTSLSRLPLVLAGGVVGSGMAIRGDTLLRYPLDRRFVHLSFQLAVPREVPPGQGIAITLTVDGQDVYRSEQRTAAQEPLSIGLDLPGARELCIAVHATPADSGDSAAAVLVDPVLVRRRAD